MIGERPRTVIGTAQFLHPTRHATQAFPVFDGGPDPISQGLKIGDLLQQSGLIAARAAMPFPQFFAILGQQLIAADVQRSRLAEQVTIMTSVGRKSDEEEHARHHDGPDE